MIFKVNTSSNAMNLNRLNFIYSIRWRIAIPYVILILVGVGGLSQYLINYTRQVQLDSLEDELISKARLLVDFISNASTESTDNKLDNAANRWSETLGVRVTIIAFDGSIIGDSHENRLEMDNHLNRIEIQEAIENGIGSSIRFSQTLAMQMMYVAIPQFEGDKIVSFLRLSIPIDIVQSRFDPLHRTIALAILITTVISILLAIIIANYISRPMREINETAKKMLMDDFDETEVQSSYDEINQLSRTIRRMSKKLRDQISDLKFERSKLSTILRQMTDGILIVDAKGQIELINPAAERIFNLKEENIRGRSLISILRHHEIDELWRHSYKNEKVDIASIELRIKDHYLQVICIPIGKSYPGSTLLLFQDLTNLRRLEVIRRDFVSNISHELRTPLASVKALTETLQEGALEDATAARHFLSKIESEVDSISQLVQELLELARIESGKVPLILRGVSPKDLIQPIVDRMQIQAKRSEIELGWECPEHLSQVLADPPRIEQVLSNLLNNALKFTPSGGIVMVSCIEKLNYIQFSVKDTGRGIPADDLYRIFERFYKTDRSRSGGGTGLGLAIARHLVEAHNGRIWVESQEGKGSTFHFTLPKAPKA
jgi:two-component system, OmpR family, phosphate regulon sensor histidine kinase PhoR